ncbi:enoyl-CoA hydratase [Moraxella macacae 0408225]|uniref:3-hydroxyisobutyryl-CoA hydrolase n=2 Tax=Moraxella macacae TaxID=765840 RepID=L2F881_9GAMM|nr:enoyl-CoA hydratase [Moraxella macacae 0408225]
MNETYQTVKTDFVLFDTLPTDDGNLLGMITLNAPKALNALDLTMCQQILQQLQIWQNEAKIVAIFLQGTGEKAFCAGGNIRKIYDSMIQKPAVSEPCPINLSTLDYAEAFFVNEYRLNRYMASYTKPIIAWASGIVMGGGLGLVATCSHRIVTETTRFAMPEINIGLFPDATGSWFLQKMPAQTGLFFGLTGANGNAGDALLANLAEFSVRSEQKSAVLQALQKADWQKTCAKFVVSQALSQLHTTEHLPDSHVVKHWQTLQKIVNAGDMLAIDDLLRNSAFIAKYCQDEWLAQAIDTYQHGCPVSASLTFALFHRLKTLSLPKILQIELNTAIHCCHFPDFREGVRALLVDKDKNPMWHKTLATITPEYINTHFDDVYQGDELLVL